MGFGTLKWFPVPPINFRKINLYGFIKKTPLFANNPFLGSHAIMNFSTWYRVINSQVQNGY